MNRTQKVVLALAWAAVVVAVVLGVTAPDAPADGGWFNYAPNNATIYEGPGLHHVDPWFRAAAWAAASVLAGGGAVLILRGWSRAQRIAVAVAAAVILLAPVSGFEAARAEHAGGGEIFAATMGDGFWTSTASPPAGALADVSPWATVGLLVLATLLWLGSALWLFRDRPTRSTEAEPEDGPSDDSGPPGIAVGR